MRAPVMRDARMIALRWNMGHPWCQQ